MTFTQKRAFIFIGLLVASLLSIGLLYFISNAWMHTFAQSKTDSINLRYKAATQSKSYLGVVTNTSNVLIPTPRSGSETYQLISVGQVDYYLSVPPKYLPVEVGDTLYKSVLDISETYGTDTHLYCVQKRSIACFFGHVK